MRGIVARLVIGSLAVLLSSLYSGSSAQGRELLRERFENVRPEILADNTVAGKDGARRGFSSKESAKPFRDTPMDFLDLPVSFDNASVRGAISFDLQRKTGSVPSDRRTLFEFLDAGGGQILAFQVEWTSAFDPRLPMLSIKGDDYWVNGSGLWSQQVLLDREVVPGQWIHVDIAWDDAAKQYVIAVDGRAQDVAPKSYDWKRHTVLPDRRLDTKRRLKPGNLPSPSSVRSPFSYFLARTATFRIGVNSHPRKPHIAASFLSHSVLDNFVVLADGWPRGLGGEARILSVSDDTFKVPGISGKLVAGDTVSVILAAIPGGKATFDMGNVKAVPMAEVPPTAGAPGVPAVDNGTYLGTYTIKPGDDFENGQIVGNFISPDNVAAVPVLSASKWTIVTKPAVTFKIDRTDLPADSASKARIKLAAVDANGKPVKGRHLKLTLATTDEYTGTVGAGDFGKDVGATVETRWKGETDSWGEVEFDYTAGFAAKTVILSAKDLDSGGVSVDYLTAYKEASIDIALTRPVSRAAARRGGLYLLKVEATRTELTADGRSRSVIRATLIDPTGASVPGDPVVFTLSSPNGTLRTIAGTTDSTGTATAEYVAGKKIGIVVVTATATLRGATGNVSITLLSDAPAKIWLKAKPETLPADGFSRADLSVKVTDINDNPNKDTKVEFRIAKGGGKMEYLDRITDRFGDTQNRYTSGTTPGIATVVATVRSKVPTEAELAKARNVLFVPYNPEGDEIRVEKWRKKKGDTVLAGEAVLEYTVGRSREIRVLAAPCDLTLWDILVEYWDNAEVGQTLAVYVPVVQPAATTVAPAPARRRR
ncbi:MAG: invasin domain 3-containing protein [bacterium]|jgi:hypothetical protein